MYFVSASDSSVFCIASLLGLDAAMRARLYGRWLDWDDDGPCEKVRFINVIIY